MSRIAILGGTFDPIHAGHIELAKQTIKRCQVDEVWFMPTYITPLKDRKITTFELRLKMIVAAIKPYRKIKVSTLEKTLPTPSYTLNTVLKLKEMYPQHQFYWIIGDDQYANFDKWKNIQQLKKEITFICFHRERKITEKDSGVIFIEDFSIPFSSTEVRSGEMKQTVNAVQRVIFKYGLYLDEILQNKMSHDRFVHSQSVATLCVQLAKAHHVDPMKAYIAGMLHDVCKEFNVVQARKIMEISFPQYLERSEKIWHQWLAVNYIKHTLHYCDQEVLNAVAHHVTGTGKSKLAKILYIADKIDPLRGFDISKKLVISLKDLNQGLAFVRIQHKNFLKKQEDIHV